MADALSRADSSRILGGQHRSARDAARLRECTGERGEQFRPPGGGHVRERACRVAVPLEEGGTDKLAVVRWCSRT